MGQDIINGRGDPTWTNDDKKRFLIYAARYRWDRNVLPTCPNMNGLQKELRVHTQQDDLLNTMMRDRLAAAVRNEIQMAIQRLPSLAQWPVWTRRWFLDPNWRGHIVQPSSKTLPTVNLACANAQGYEWVVNAVTEWDKWDEAAKQRAFLAVRNAAKAHTTPIDRNPAIIVFRASDNQH